MNKKVNDKKRLNKKSSTKMNTGKAFAECDCGWAKIGSRDTAVKSQPWPWSW